jgi:ribonuclease-3
MTEALTHKSYAADHNSSMSHHERLEFLGDAVLGSSIARGLYEHFPDETESILTLYKISLVREETLALVAQQIGLDQQILISRGEERTEGRNKPAILADCLEALIGMLSVSHGYSVADTFVKNHILILVDRIHEFLPIKSAKSRVQEYVQSLHKQLPIYQDTVAKYDTKNNPTQFRSTLIVDGHEVSSGVSTSKKKAQEIAADDFLQQIK